MKNKYIHTFQYLRVFAFLLIFISHCSFLTTRTVYLGAFGVSIFIMMSGFLEYLKTPLDNKMCIDINRLKKRVVQIFPLHFITFLMAVPLSGVIGEILAGHTDTLIGYGLRTVVNLSMLQSFVPNQGWYFSFNSVSWYLTIVFVLEVISKPVAYIVRLCVCKIRGWIWIGLIMLVQVVYTLLVSQSQIAHWLVYINPLFRVLDFMIGMFLAAECTKIKEKSKWSGLLLFLPVVIMVLSCFVGESIPYIKNMFLNVIWIPASIIIIKMLYEINEHNTVPQGIIYSLGGIGLELFLIH
ncbi:MAG: acyltransferase [Ruminococcaceae bacterium]|nr:acyltransferase [Oscillospiraceae bacterium]